MKTVSQYIEEKMDEAVAHYMITHPTNEVVHLDNGMPLSLQDGRQVLTLMHPSNFHTSLHSRSIGEVGEGMNETSSWSEEMLDAERLAAFVGLLPPNSRQPIHGYVKVTRSEVESPSMLDAPIRLFNYQNIDDPHSSQLGEQQSVLPSLPRCSNAEEQWITDKQHKSSPILPEPESQVIEIASPAPSNKHHSKKSLPHKKRISKKLKRNAGNTTPQQDMVVITVNQEEILPDNYTSSHTITDSQQATHEPTPFQLRSVLICQICGDYYGEEQLKFYQHLKHHYEPQSTIIIENPVSDLGIDKMTNTCVVDNHSLLPDSLVELSLENTLPTTKSMIYQPMKDSILTTNEKPSYNGNKVLYSVTNQDEYAKSSLTFGSAEKAEVYNCAKCNSAFRKHRHYEMHLKVAHSKQISPEISEFSEPEDLMEGIQVNVAEDVSMTGSQSEAADNEHAAYSDTSLILTVDNGHVHQEDVKNWYIRNNVECNGEGYCSIYPPQSAQQQSREPDAAGHSKAEELSHLLDAEAEPETDADARPPHGYSKYVHELNSVPSDDNSRDSKLKINLDYEDNLKTDVVKKNAGKKFECATCGKIFRHRNSLLYHISAHKGVRPHKCKECGKAFVTTGALKIHAGRHTDARPHKCKECGKLFRQWGDLKYHTASIHSQQKPFECEFCGKKFARKYSYNVHVRIHTGEKNYKCHYCTKTFRASSYRLIHMRIHTGEKPHKCQLCDKAFRSASDLRRHSGVHKKQSNKLLKTTNKEDYKEDDNKKKIKKTPPVTKPALKRNEKRVAKKSCDVKAPPNITINSHSKNELRYVLETRIQRDRAGYIESVSKVKDEALPEIADIKPNVAKDNITHGDIIERVLTELYNIPA